MRKVLLVVLLAAAVVSLVIMMKKDSGQRPEMPTAGQPPAPDQSAAVTGTVLETMDAGRYTYIYVDTGKEKIWAAGPITPVVTGSDVAFAAQMKMTDFKSEALNRTFESIYFVPEIRTGGGSASGQVVTGHPQPASSDAELDGMDFAGIKVPSGGKNIETVYADKAKLSGQVVVVRGKVVKFTSGVMGKNWIHLRDGTGSEGTNDLTVTTNVVAKIGDTVVVKGPLTVGKDFGFGYAYEVIIEDAEVDVE